MQNHLKSRFSPRSKKIAKDKQSSQSEVQEDQLLKKQSTQSDEDTIYHLQQELSALKNEKLNWLAFQAYFESQLTKFTNDTSLDDFSSFIYSFNKAKASNNSNSFLFNKANDSQDLKQSTTAFDSRHNTYNKISDSPQKTYFTINILKDSISRIKLFQDKFATILAQPAKSNSKSTGISSKASSIDSTSQLKSLMQEIMLFCSEITSLQVLIFSTNYQVKEDESIQDLVRQNLLLEKQIQLLIETKGKPKIKVTQNHDLEKLIFKTRQVASENKEETQIFQLTSQLLSSQIDQLHQQIAALIEENTKLKAALAQLQDIHFLENSNSKSKSKQQEFEIKDLEKVVEKMKKELAIAEEKPTRTQCVINIYHTDQHHLFNCEQQPVQQESNQLLEQQVTQLRKALITLDKEQKEKESLIKNLKEQIANQSDQIEFNQSKLKEKIQENTAYLTQIQEINKMAAQAKVHRAIIAALQEENEKLKQQSKNMNDQLGTFLSLEQETRKRQQSSVRKENTAQNLHKEMGRLMEELRNTQETLAQRIIDSQQKQVIIGKQELEKNQLQAEIDELTKQISKPKKSSMTTTFIVSEDSSASEEFLKIHQENKQKMVQMKSKLLGLKINIEKHGEKVGVISKTPGKSHQDIVKETEYQNQLIIQELMYLIDQISELQRKIDLDYEQNFAKMNEKQRILLQQNMQLKQDLKKYLTIDMQMREKEDEITKLSEQLKMITIEHYEYQDIVRSKIAQLQKDQKKEIKAEISPEDIEMHQHLKEIESLQHQLNDANQQINMLKTELKNRQSEQPPIPPELLAQLQQMQMMQMQEDSQVRNAARTIQQNNLEVKQADILHKKINDLTEKLSNKTLESQKYRQEKNTLEDRFKQEKQEWLNQIAKKDKQFEQLETKYRKCLEQYEELQQKYFKLEEDISKNESGHQNERLISNENESDSD